MQELTKVILPVRTQPSIRVSLVQVRKMTDARRRIHLCCPYAFLGSLGMLARLSWCLVPGVLVTSCTRLNISCRCSRTTRALSVMRRGLLFHPQAGRSERHLCSGC